MKYRLFVIANLGFIIGILCGLYSKMSIILFLSIFVVWWGLRCWWVKSVLDNEVECIKRRCYKFSRYIKVYITKTVLIVFISFLILGWGLLSFRNMLFENFVDDMLSLERGENAVGIGIVVSDREEKEYSVVYRIKILEVKGTSYFNVYSFLRLKKQNGNELKYGDLVCFKGAFQEPQDRTNFKGFSYKEYLKTINVYGTFEGTYGGVRVLQEDRLSLGVLIANKVKVSFERAD